MTVQRQRNTEKGLGVPLLPLPAESPPITNSEREAAKGAEGKQQADEVTEPAPHLQQREGDGPDNRFQPVDDRRHEDHVPPGARPGRPRLSSRNGMQCREKSKRRLLLLATG